MEYNLSQESSEKLVIYNGSYIKFINNPNLKMKVYAVLHDIENKKYIKDISEPYLENIIYACEIKRVEKIPNKICVGDGTKIYGWDKIEGDNNEIVKNVHLKYDNIDQYVDIKYEKTRSEILMQAFVCCVNDKNIKYIENPCFLAQVASICQNGENIKYIKMPSTNIKIFALLKNKKNIKYIDKINPTIYAYLCKICQISIKCGDNVIDTAKKVANECEIDVNGLVAKFE